MTKLQISVLALCGLALMIGVAQATRPSGPGQTTAVNSLSVAVASDQTVPVSNAASAPPLMAVAQAPSDTADAGVNCNQALYVGVPDAGTLTAYSCGADAAVTFNGLAAGAIIPGCFRKIMATGTTVSGLVCLGH